MMKVMIKANVRRTVTLMLVQEAMTTSWIILKNITYASILQMIAVFRMRILNISHTLQMVQKEKV
ncbi:hypothetical protein ESCOCP313M_25325 [Escherichia coli]